MPSTDRLDADPWPLVERGEYQKALVAYERLCADRPDYAPHMMNRAIVLLCLGRLEEALDAVQLQDRAFRRAKKSSSESTLNMIATILWLLCRRDEAIGLFQVTMEGILERKIVWLDSSGGASTGLLSWYAGVTLSNDSVRAMALDFLRDMQQHWSTTDWPSGLVLSVLGQQKFDKAIQAEFGESDLRRLSKKAEEIAWVRRELPRALFYFAVQEREQRHESQCSYLMRRCAEVRNPHLVMEWYLARDEVNKVKG